MLDDEEKSLAGRLEALGEQELDLQTDKDLSENAIQFLEQEMGAKEAEYRELDCAEAQIRGEIRERSILVVRERALSSLHYTALLCRRLPTISLG